MYNFLLSFFYQHNYSLNAFVKCSLLSKYFITILISLLNVPYTFITVTGEEKRHSTFHGLRSDLKRKS